MDRSEEKTQVLEQEIQKFGSYLLVKRLAHGGMAEVFRARKLTTGAVTSGVQINLCIKRILPHYSENTEFIKMFIKEAEIISRLKHQNIISISDFGKFNDQYFIAMEYVQGRDLKDVLVDGIKKKNPISHELAVSIISKVALGLDMAHKAKDSDGTPLNIIHRDISPQNILLSYQGDAKLIDFGIAKSTIEDEHTRANVLKGKLSYMSPEQIKGLKLDGRTDVFALGIVLYELVTRTKLFKGQSDLDLMEKIRDGTIAPPRSIDQTIPPQLNVIIMKALEKDRDKRYATSLDFGRDLSEFMRQNQMDSSSTKISEYMHSLYKTEIEDQEIQIKEEESALKNLDLSKLADDQKPAVQAPAPPAKSNRMLILAGAALVVVTLVIAAFLFTGKGTSTATGGGQQAGAVAQFGQLTLNSVPWADVYIDGEKIGNTPLIKYKLEKGNYTVVLKNPGAGKEKSLQVAIEPDKETLITERF